MRHAVRIASAQDRASVEEVVRAAYAHYIPRIGRMPGPMLDDYGALIQDGHVYVIEADLGVQAILVLIAEVDAMLLDNVAVTPAAQGRGYGRQLMQFAEEAARAAGFQRIRLYTNEAMTENLASYARIGYVETHRAEEFGFRRVYMTKTLSRPT